MKKTYETGLLGEEIAEKYLCDKLRMTCLEHRYRTKRGEIDLVMLDGETVVFVEVKTRKTGEAGSGLAAVTTSKQRKIVHASLLYLMKRNWMNREVRFDLVEIHRGKLLHIPNAFQPYGNFYR